jgi:hypothetical protein
MTFTEYWATWAVCMTGAAVTAAIAAGVEWAVNRWRA